MPSNLPTPVFPGTKPFREKYPQISDISVSITETISGIRKEYNYASYGIQNIVPIHQCSDSRCIDGGLNLDEIISKMVSTRQSEYENNMKLCHGYIKRPRGSNPGIRCGHDFAVKINITYKDNL